MVPEIYAKMLNQSDRSIFKSTISIEQIDEKPDFLQVDIDSWKKQLIEIY